MTLLWKIALLPSVLVLAAAAQPAPPATGHYCLRTDIFVAEEEEEPVGGALEKLGDGAELRESADLGQLGVDVEVELRDGEPHVSWSTYMPDYRQTVSAGPAPSRVLPNGGLEFAFVDNWDAPGRGTLIPEGDGLVLKVARTGASPSFAGRFASRQYGEFKVHRGQCAANG